MAKTKIADCLFLNGPWAGRVESINALNPTVHYAEEIKTTEYKYGYSLCKGDTVTIEYKVERIPLNKFTEIYLVAYCDPFKFNYHDVELAVELSGMYPL